MNLQDDDTPYNFASFFSVNRFVNAESWWVASELVRRHPELIVYEMHPGGGQSDVLCVTTPDQLREQVERELPRVWLNREGSIHILRGADRETVATWPEVLFSPHPHSLVRVLEDETGWGSPQTTPAATPRTLVYRLIAASLQAMVNDRHPWDVRCDSIDSPGSFSSDNGFIARFPGADGLARESESLGIYGEPQSLFWALLRGKEPVALFSLGGDVLTASGVRMDVMQTYRERDRSIRKVTAELLDMCE